ncbi:hypothetical protein BH10BAC6_BH10BAC6_18480 [soil metagenome]
MFESIDQNEYEILIRKRGENDYASYCPQLAHMIKGSEHVEVEEAMKAYVLDYIVKIKERSAPQQN